MAERLLDKRWPWIAAAAVILGVFVSTFVEFRFDRDLDRRPEGSVEDIVGLFQELYEAGQTVVIITHDPAIASQASRTVHIRDGLIVEDQATAA